MERIELDVPLRLIYDNKKPLVIDQVVEITIMENIKMNTYDNSSLIDKLTQKVLNTLYQSENEIFPIKAIEKFYGFKDFINILTDKLDTVNMYILNKIDNPFIVDYYFKEWKNEIAVFEILLPGVENVEIS